MKFSVESLCQGYGSYEVLKDISFVAESGEVLALLGPNGSGKSTLIKTMCNILPPKSGRLMIDGQNLIDMDLTDVAKLISYVPQSSPNSVFTKVIDTVLLGRRPYVTWSYREKDIDIAIDSMRKMKIESLSDNNVSELSGGQKQRVYLARSLAQCPSFFLFDEPTSALDLKYQMNTMIAMDDIVHNHNAGMIIALHDINLALNYSDKVLMIKDKEIYAYGPPQTTITEDTIRDVYGVESEIITNKTGGRYILPISPCDDISDL